MAVDLDALDGAETNWCAAGFEAQLGRRFSLGELQQHPQSVIGLWPDLTIGYLNPAWVLFAGANGPGPSPQIWMGRNYLDAIAPTARPFYRALIEQTPSPELSLHPRDFEYDCSSPDIFRRFVMHIYVLPAGGGWLIINSTRVETRYDALSPRVGLEHYLFDDEWIRQCAYCRRVKHAVFEDRWDWLTTPWPISGISITHGMCGVCAAYYSPRQGS